MSDKVSRERGGVVSVMVPEVEGERERDRERRRKREGAELTRGGGAVVLVMYDIWGKIGQRPARMKKSGGHWGLNPGPLVNVQTRR